jgi:hypothetical protein
MKSRFLALSFLAAAVAGAAAQSADLAAEGKAWWAHIQYLADDKLEGRNVGTPGFDKAVEYVEQQFQAIGLKPLGDPKSGPGGAAGYRQAVKLDARLLVPEASSLALVRDGKDTPLAIGQDATMSARADLGIWPRLERPISSQFKLR